MLTPLGLVIIVVASLVWMFVFARAVHIIAKHGFGQIPMSPTTLRDFRWRMAETLGCGLLFAGLCLAL